MEIMTGHTCDSCSFNGTLLEVVQHNRKVHVSDKTDATSCCICSGRVLSCNLRRHIRNCHPDDCAVRCYICSEPFVEDKDMRNHVRCGCLKHPGKARSSFIIGEKKKSKKRGQASTASAASIPANFNSFLDHCRPDDVNKYISKHLQTDAAYRSECSDVVDRVDTFFEDCEGFTLDRFIQGGSIGKGTVIKSKSDIDCVMFTSNLPSIDSPDYSRQLQFSLEWVEDKLKESRLSIAYNLEVLGRTSHAVKLRVKTKKKGHESHDVDLLLATDLLGECPTQEHH
ncbi:uncharacterized protein LOC118421967 [Branchiostoma floridae]|uniref:Uncharacterized protein LOC118421967 n=1 Tax=Branchiostoma floridae TaxID=7739 RepID=A0A9J7LMK7_BRAFL|nr:uncharacterized protein LOC118421967 [Branchiostoma floridae]